MTPKSEQNDNIIIRCLQKDPGPAVLCRVGDVLHHHYTHDPKSGLALIDAQDMSKNMPLGSHLRSTAHWVLLQLQVGVGSTS